MQGEELTDHVKNLALELGVVKVGVASRQNLTGPPEANLDNILVGATHAISFMTVEPEDCIFDYLSKANPTPYRDHFYENIQLLGEVGIALAEELRSLGYRAKAISPNGVYAKGSNPGYLVPPFSHRYAAHAAGVGAIGLSGNVMSPEHGTRIYLSTVAVDAPLIAEGPLKENPCDDCKLCIEACPAGFMLKNETVTFTLGGQEITHAKKRSHAACGISCSGFTGLSRDGKWSSLAPSLFEIPEDDGDAERLFSKLLGPRVGYLAAHPEKPNFLRLIDSSDGYDDGRTGIIARNRHDTHTTCGNCAIVCLETKRQRARALKTLRNSGVVIGENEDGSPIVVSADEAREYRKTHRPEWVPDGLLD